MDKDTLIPQAILTVVILGLGFSIAIILSGNPLGTIEILLGNGTNPYGVQGFISMLALLVGSLMLLFNLYTYISIRAE